MAWVHFVLYSLEMNFTLKSAPKNYLNKQITLIGDLYVM